MLSFRRLATFVLPALLLLALGSAVAVAGPGSRPSAPPGLGAGGNPGAQVEHEGPDEASAHGRAVSELARSLEGGCEKGQAISALASSKSREHRQDDPDKPDPCTRGDGQGDAGEERAAGRPDHAGPPADVPGAAHAPGPDAAGKP